MKVGVLECAYANCGATQRHASAGGCAARHPWCAPRLAFQSAKPSCSCTAHWSTPCTLFARLRLGERRERVGFIRVCYAGDTVSLILNAHEVARVRRRNNRGGRGEL